MQDPAPVNSPSCLNQDDTLEFPPAKIPLTPPLTSSTLGFRRGTCPSLLDANHIRVSAGRGAIALALQHAEIGASDEVLVPAYHCESMIAPVAHVGAKPVYYRIEPDTKVDLADIQGKISPHTRAILATHYFGFPQLVRELRDLCGRNDLILIEDCAHAFFGRIEGQPLGSFGDYAIGSAMKFFPLFDGGILASTRHELSSIKLFRPSLIMELKGLTTVIEHAIRYKRLALVSAPLKLALKIKDVTWSAMKKVSRHRLSEEVTPASSQGGYALEPRWINARMSRISQFIMTHTQTQRVCDTRRRHYQKILDALEGIPGIEPLVGELPEETVPLVVPMIVHKPQESFRALKNAGVPVWRFGEYLDPQITEDVCRNSVLLSKHVFQFPCHPELTDAEIDWMVSTIKQNLAS